MIDMDWKYEYLVDQLHRTAYKKHESFIIGSLIHDEALSMLKPCLQYYVRRTDGRYALLDLYYPQIELAVEIDEPHHDKHKKADEKRQRVVEKYLACDFFRIVIKHGNIKAQIKTLKNLIIKKISQYKKNGSWSPWLKPRKLDIFEAKKEFKESLFLKIKGEINPDELMSRQMGYWRIAQDKQNKIKQVIVVHNSVVSRIFKNITWYVWDKDPSKVGYKGEEIESDSIVGSIIENWKWQQTVTYSDDVY